MIYYASILAYSLLTLSFLLWGSKSEIVACFFEEGQMGYRRS